MRPKREHYEKYKTLAEAFGIETVKKLLPDGERIRAAIAAGDEHLNTIGLAVWDRAAGRVGVDGPFAAASTKVKCPMCGEKTYRPPLPPHVGNQGFEMSIEPPWNLAFSITPPRDRKVWWSLAERVCVLKWVARHVVAGVPAPNENE